MTSQPTTWVGVRLLTPDGLPVAGGSYQLTASDGGAHDGGTDDEGRGRVAPLAPGECVLWPGLVVLSTTAPTIDQAPWPPVSDESDGDEAGAHASEEGGYDLGGRAALVTEAVADSADERAFAGREESVDNETEAEES